MRGDRSSFAIIVVDLGETSLGGGEECDCVRVVYFAKFSFENRRYAGERVLSAVDEQWLGHVLVQPLERLVEPEIEVLAELAEHFQCIIVYTVQTKNEVISVHNTIVGRATLTRPSALWHDQEYRRG